MGWCSGTEIFDTIAEYFLSKEYQDDMYGAASKRLRSPMDQVRHSVLLRLAEIMEDHDWDCQSDSAYQDDPKVRAVFQELHPDWDWEDTDEPSE